MKSMALNFVLLDGSKVTKRWDRKNGQETQVDYLSAVVNYNQNVRGSVDLRNGLLSYYRISVKSKKWYHRLIWHFLDIAIVQDFILQKRDTDNANLNLKAFKI